MCPIISAINRDSQSDNFYLGEWEKKIKEEKVIKRVMFGVKGWPAWHFVKCSLKVISVPCSWSTGNWSWCNKTVNDFSNGSKNYFKNFKHSTWCKTQSWLTTETSQETLWESSTAEKWGLTRILTKPPSKCILRKARRENWRGPSVK